MSQPKSRAKSLAADLKAIQRRAGDVIDSDDSETLHRAAAELRRLSTVDAERDELRDHLQFVERWANHHGQKPHVSPAEALAVIQHYPPIKDITKSYGDGKLPTTPDPWAERDALAAELERVKGERVPLSDEALDALWRAPMSADWEHREFARAIEHAHGIKEDGNV